MKMKTLVFSTAVLLGFSTYSLAFTIDNSTNVGDLDTLKAASNFSEWGSLGISGNGSGQEAETSWVNYALGTTDVTYEVKTESVSVTTVDFEPSIGAFELKKAPEYFLVKDGRQNTDNNTHWLFENTASLDWGVVDFEALFGSNWNNEGFTISHVTEFVGDIPVPEPGTLALIVTGIAGLFAARRTRKAV